MQFHMETGITSKFAKCYPLALLPHTCTGALLRWLARVLQCHTPGKHWSSSYIPFLTRKVSRKPFSLHIRLSRVFWNSRYLSLKNIEHSRSLCGTKSQFSNEHPLDPWRLWSFRGKSKQAIIWRQNQFAVSLPHLAHVLGQCLASFQAIPVGPQHHSRGGGSKGLGGGHD